MPTPTTDVGHPDGSTAGGVIGSATIAVCIYYIAMPLNSAKPNSTGHRSGS